MANQNEVLRGLEEASQKHEKEIVVELAWDRVLHYTGVYLILLLAAIGKLSQLAGKNISCYPANNGTDYSSGFIAYIVAYCWESSDVSLENPACTQNDGPDCAPPNNSCSLQGVKYQQNLMKNPSLLKSFLLWMPYLMLLEAILFSVPSAWWHFRVGARLMGHLKFTKLLLNDIYEALKTLPIAAYQGKPYDEESYYLDGCRRFDPSRTANDKSEVPSSGGGFLSCIRRRFAGHKAKDDGAGVVPVRGADFAIPMAGESIASGSKSKEDKPLLHREIGDANGDGTHLAEESPETAGASVSKVVEKKQASTENQSQAGGEVNKDAGTSGKDGGTKPPIEQGSWSRIFFGEMQDRHLFSMICSENFSSLEHHPYILSVFQLSPTPKKKDKPRNLPMKEGILKQMCHEKNFTGRLLIHTYFIKHALGAVISMVFLAVSIAFVRQVGVDSLGSESFKCDVMYHEELCVICTMHRQRDMFALLLVNLIVIFGYFVVSIGHWIYVRSSGSRSSSYFFEDINDSSSVALMSAHILQQRCVK